jgi:acetyl-CoA C-acetyltransferase
VKPIMSQSTNKDQEIFIAGTGITPAGEHWERSLRELALQAISLARAEAGGMKPEAIYVANMLAPALSRQSQLGALLADFASLHGVEAATIEAAGASGGMALRQAYLALRSGEVSSVLVVGVEKVTERVSAELEAAITTSSDADYESIHGTTQTSLAAMLMRRYLYDHELPADALADFSLLAHANGANNPNAMFRKPIKRETYQRSPMVSDPLNMFDAAPMADGAAALLLVRGDNLPDLGDTPRVRISGSGASTSTIAIHDRPDPLRFAAAAEATQQALVGAGIPLKEIDFFELHDRYSIFAALSLEAAGLAAPGEGWRYAAGSASGEDGYLPLCTLGGSKARGEIGGATGVYQAAEATLQLQGRAGGAQVKDARNGMIQCLGGMAATAVSHILTRVDGR